MSEYKIVPDGSDPDVAPPRAALPVLASEAGFTRRDLDLIKRDLISVRKDYNEIRNNMVILTHQHSSAPSKGFFIAFGVVWLIAFAVLLVAQPLLAEVGKGLLAHLPQR